MIDWNLWLSSTLFYEGLAVGYLLGSVPFGFLIARYFLGYDITKKGSGNIGMSNMLRNSGYLPAACTLFLDAGKGSLAVGCMLVLFPAGGLEAAGCAGAFAVLGHTKSLFLKGKGGKGVATNLGVWLALFWPAGLAFLLCWGGLYSYKKTPSLSSLVGLVILPLVVVLANSWWLFGMAVLLSAYLFYTQKSNIQRLLSKQELKA